MPMQQHIVLTIIRHSGTQGVIIIPSLVHFVILYVFRNDDEVAFPEYSLMSSLHKNRSTLVNMYRVSHNHLKINPAF